MLITAENMMEPGSIAVAKDILYTVSSIGIHRIDIQTKKVDFIHKGNITVNQELK